MEAAHPKPFLAAPSLSTGLFKITNSDVKQRVKTLKLYNPRWLIYGKCFTTCPVSHAGEHIFAEMSMMSCEIGA
jgi:hypothetical protein